LLPQVEPETAIFEEMIGGLVKLDSMAAVLSGIALK
jgi:hypothetical protein